MPVTPSCSAISATVNGPRRRIRSSNARSDDSDIAAHSPGPTADPRDGRGPRPVTSTIVGTFTAIVHRVAGIFRQKPCEKSAPPWPHDTAIRDWRRGRREVPEPPSPCARQIFDLTCSSLRCRWAQAPEADPRQFPAGAVPAGRDRRRPHSTPASPRAAVTEPPSPLASADSNAKRPSPGGAWSRGTASREVAILSQRLDGPGVNRYRSRSHTRSSRWCPGLSYPGRSSRRWWCPSRSSRARWCPGRWCPARWCRWSAWSRSR